MSWRREPRLSALYKLGRLLNLIGESLATRGADLMAFALARLLRKQKDGE